jgi:hypothetical protein
MKLSKSHNIQNDEIFVSGSESVQVTGPTTSRHCTDVLFLLLFLATFVCMNGIGLAAVGLLGNNKYIPTGNPLRLVHGSDYKGALCGYDDVVVDLPNKWQPNMLGVTPNSQGEFVSVAYAICVSSCPSYLDTEYNPYNDDEYWIAPVSTMNVLGYCLPVDSIRTENFLESSFADFVRAARIIVIFGFICAVLFSLLFLITIRIPCVLRTVVWLSIALICGILFGGGYVILEKVKKEQDLQGAAAPSKQQIMLEKGVGAALVICGVIWVSVLCVMRERIALAITLVRESVKAMISMPLLIFFPLFQCIVFGLLTALWGVYSAYLISSGELTTETDDFTGSKYTVLKYDKNATHAIAFLVFAWIWSTAFVEALGQMLCSHAVLVWYFATNRKHVSSAQVFKSAGVCFRYHCGTAAFGSLLIAILQSIRMSLEYVKAKIGARRSTLARLLACLLGYLLWCFEKCLQFVCDAAYVQCAMHGTPFCTSSFRGVSLIARNLGRVSSVTAVAVFVVVIGKLSIALTAALTAYQYFSVYMSQDLNGPIMSSVLVGYIAYQVSSLFLNVVSSTAGTILQAFLIEEEIAEKFVEIDSESKYDDEIFSDDALDIRTVCAELKDCDTDTAESNLNVIVVSAGTELPSFIEMRGADRANNVGVVPPKPKNKPTAQEHIPSQATLPLSDQASNAKPKRYFEWT